MEERREEEGGKSNETERAKITDGVQVGFFTVKFKHAKSYHRKRSSLGDTFLELAQGIQLVLSLAFFAFIFYTPIHRRLLIPQK